MSKVILNKSLKKIKVELTSKNYLKITGPLGVVIIKDTNLKNLKDNSLYIPKQRVNILLNNIKKAFIGVSRG